MFSLRNKPEKKKINKKKRKESPFQTFSIFGSTSPKKHAALSQTKKSDPISSEPKPGLLNKKLLNSIRSFNLKVFYSYEAKRDEQHHSDQCDQKFSYIRRNDIEIAKDLNKIRNLLSKNADPNSHQFLHEAVFLYFIYRDLELSKFYEYHDHSEPDNQLKLIHLLLEYGANLTIYKHPASTWEYELASLRCFSNLWNQLRFGKGLNPKQMDGLSPLDYATQFQSKYPEMYEQLKCYQEARLDAAVSNTTQRTSSIEQPIGPDPFEEQPVGPRLCG